MKLSAAFLFLMIFINSELFSQSKIVIEGSISDKSTGKSIPGASIRVSGTNRGTYSSGNGFFRLYVTLGDTLLIRSIGYEPFTAVIKSKDGDFKFELKSVPIQKGNVDVTAAITAEQIIERAVKKRDENLAKLKTFSGQLYSKLVMEMGGTLVSLSGNSVTVTATISTGKEENETKNFAILETFSDIKKDYTKNISEVTITNRRQTANIPADENILAITEFFSFYDDEINFLNTKMPSPIGADGLSTYNYTLKQKIEQDDRYIYILGVEPKSTVFPGFTGEVRIIEGSYNIVELDLKPSATTVIPFFKDISVKQQYNESQEKVWYPAFLDVTAKADVKILSGVADFSIDLKATSIFSDAKINPVLPDSFYIRDLARRSINVSPLADKPDSAFWKQNSLRELSDREVEIYAKIDSVVKLDTSKAKQPEEVSNFYFTYMNPYFDFNRVSSVSLGLSPKLYFYNFELNTTGYFSFGLQDWFGSAELKLPSLIIGPAVFQLSGKVYSQQNTFGTTPGGYPRIINTIAAAIGHEDYNDYYQADGFTANLGILYKNLKFNLSADFARNFALNKNTDKSIFESYEWRNNLHAWEGNYQVGRATLDIGSINTILPSGKFDAEINLSGFYGNEVNSKQEFSGVSGRLIFSIPTFYTGYQPMNLFLTLSGGVTSDETPVQYQHRMGTRLFILNNMGNFYTAPIGQYGGNEYYSVQALYNLTDIWWRWLGLPTYLGRGLDLTIGGTFGKFNNSTASFYRPTSDEGYAEAGFGFSRIPIFISDVIFWSFDLRFGIGKEAEGRTGAAVSVSLPF